MSNQYHCALVKTSLLCAMLAQTATAALPQPNLIDINPAASSNPKEIVNVNGTAYFVANDGTHGQELWKSDGTLAGTVLVKDIVNLGEPGNAGSNPKYLTNVNGTLYFSAWNSIDNSELWRSDGTEAGTTRVLATQQAVKRGGGPRALVNANGTLFYFSNGFDLWKSDGTEGGSSLVKDLFTGSLNHSDKPSDLIDVNGRLFFTAYNADNGRELWTSDGTEAGTVLLKDINDGSDSSNPSRLTRSGNTLFFTADDAVNGKELWKSDGTPSGTVLVSDIIPGGAGSQPSELTDANGTLFFSAFSQFEEGLYLVNNELWKTDGTAAGTVQVKNIVSDDNIDFTLLSGNPLTDLSGSSYPSNLTHVNDTLFFTAFDDLHQRGLWSSNAAGTQLVKYIPSPAGSHPRGLVNIGGTLYFTAFETGFDLELWLSDGTEAGTTRVKDLLPGVGSSDSTDLTDINGALFFAASDGEHGKELWATINNAPVAQNDHFIVSSDSTFFLPAAGVLSNDTDASGENLSVILSTTTSNGSLALHSNGSFTYNSAPGFTGVDSFTYRATDGQLNSNIATVELSVEDMSNCPLATLSPDLRLTLPYFTWDKSDEQSNLFLSANFKFVPSDNGTTVFKVIDYEILPSDTENPSCTTSSLSRDFTLTLPKVEWNQGLGQDKRNLSAKFHLISNDLEDIRFELTNFNFLP